MNLQTTKVIKSEDKFIVLDNIFGVGGVSVEEKEALTEAENTIYTMQTAQACLGMLSDFINVGIYTNAQGTVTFDAKSGKLLIDLQATPNVRPTEDVTETSNTKEVTEEVVEEVKDDSTVQQ